jgi:hypothetical protein
MHQSRIKTIQVTLSPTHIIFLIGSHCNPEHGGGTLFRNVCAILFATARKTGLSIVTANTSDVTKNVDVPASPNDRGRVTSPFTRHLPQVLQARGRSGPHTACPPGYFDSKSKPLLSDDSDSTKQTNKQTNKLHGLSPRANYTDRATAACRRSDCQLLRIEGAMWSA